MKSPQYTERLIEKSAWKYPPQLHTYCTVPGWPVRNLFSIN
jgi:hypothetical protein